MTPQLIAIVTLMAINIGMLFVTARLLGQIDAERRARMAAERTRDQYAADVVYLYGASERLARLTLEQIGQPLQTEVRDVRSIES